MKTELLISSIFLMFAIHSCKERADPSEPDSVSFNVPVKTPKAIQYSSLTLNKIALDSFPTSFVGKSYVCNKKILFVDRNLSWIFEFDTSGRYIGRHIGKGKGKDELPIK